jgi:flagellar basal body-associated protein FliL
MENAESSKKRKLMKVMVFVWILAATLGGCVISLNIQKNNNNSDQKVEQNESMKQKNDSTNYNLNVK